MSLVNSVAFSTDHMVKIWGPATGALLETLEDANSVGDVAFSADGRTLASVSKESGARYAATGALLWAREGQVGGRIGCIAISADGKTLGSGSSDPTIRIWDVSIKTSVRTLNDQMGAVPKVIFSAEFCSGPWKSLQTFLEALCFLLMDDTGIKIWNVATGDLLQTLKGTTSVLFSTDGRVVVSASSATHVPIHEIRCHSFENDRGIT